MSTASQDAPQTSPSASTEQILTSTSYFACWLPPPEVWLPRQTAPEPMGMLALTAICAAVLLLLFILLLSLRVVRVDFSSVFMDCCVCHSCGRSSLRTDKLLRLADHLAHRHWCRVACMRWYTSCAGAPLIGCAAVFDILLSRRRFEGERRGEREKLLPDSTPAGAPPHCISPKSGEKVGAGGEFATTRQGHAGVTTSDSKRSTEADKATHRSLPLLLCYMQSTSKRPRSAGRSGPDSTRRAESA